ncbi:MAG: hypothetical protein AB1640_11795 [bacterium]
MGSRFNIEMQRAGGDLELRLAGDFNDVSAHELIECLRENSRDVNVAIIETNGLECVHASGQDIFRQRLHDLKDLCYRLVFYGKHAPELAPPWIEYF